jgi:hypothetical protein
MNNPTKLALILLACSVLVYFGFDVSSVNQKRADDIRKKNLLVTGIENIKMAADARLNASQKAELQELTLIHQQATDDSSQIKSLKKIAGFWYEQKEFELAGYHEEEIAKKLKSPEAWSKAGMSYFEGIDQAHDEKRRLYCYQNAETAFQNAQSLEPSNPEHELYQALCYVKVPGENPMKGILMLRDLESKFPEYMPIQINLVKLAMQTNQLDRAKSRLVKILEKKRDLAEANCLMVEVLSKLGEQDKLSEYKKFCNLKI